MATIPYNLKNDYVESAPPSAADLNRRAKVLAAQLPGVFQAIGAGVIASPDGNSLKVIDEEGVYYVSEGEAFVRYTNGYLLRIHVAGDFEIEDVPEGEIRYVQLRAYIADLSATPDSETAALGMIELSEDEEEAGALVLARINADGTVDDLRTWTRIDDLLQRIEQLESDVGYDDTEREKGSVAERLNSIGGDAGAYWGTLQLSAGDATTIAQYVAAQINALRSELQAQITSGGVRADSPELKMLTEELAAQGIGLTQVNPDWPDMSRGTYIDIEVRGDGVGVGPDDLDEGTATVYPDEQSIGPA